MSALQKILSGLATTLMKFQCKGASWIIRNKSHNSMKIRENPQNVLPGLWILVQPNTMYLYFSHSQTFRQLINIKICA